MSDFSAGLRRRLKQARRALAAAQEAADDYGVLTHASEVEELERVAAAHGIQVIPAQSADGLGSAGRAED